jgi:antitoxin component of MazEF toxin-antitoxin module
MDTIKQFKIGNSYAVRLTEKLCNEVGILPTDELIVTVDPEIHSINLTKVDKSQNGAALQEYQEYFDDYTIRIVI